MPKYLMTGLGLMLAVTVCQAAGDALPPLTKNMPYFDGQQWREVWVNEREVAEFLPAPRAKSQVRSFLPNARLSRTGERVQIWSIDSLDNATTLNQQSKRSIANGDVARSKFSPVFHRSAKGGPRLALGGGVIVRFKPDWTEEMIAGWAAENELNLKKILNVATRTYVFEDGAGMAVLEKANAIQQSGEVESAIPEWWRGVHKR